MPYFYKEFIDKTVVLRCDWEATIDIITNKATISATLSYDTSKRGLWNSPNVNGNKAIAYIKINDKTYRFDVPTMSGNKNHIVGTVKSDPIKLNDEASTPININCTLDFGETLKFYKSLISSEFIEAKSLFMADLIRYIEPVYRTSHISGTSGSLILGVDHTFIIEKAHDDFTHTIEYFCGTKSGMLCNQEPGVTVSANLPIDLAKEQTERPYVDIDFKITTYYGDAPLKNETVTKRYDMPDSVAPSCTIAVSDAEALTDTYGAYVQRWSRLFINVAPTISYDAPIVRYTISANGTVYEIENNTVTTSLLKNSGKQTVSVVVTDSRGRTATDEVEIDVLPWANPYVHLKAPFRTDADGNYQSDGEYITIAFDASVSPLNGKNSAEYRFEWRKVSGLAPGKDILEHYADMLTVTDGKFTFEADKGAAYEITLYVTDDFYTSDQSRGGSNAVVLMHFGSDGESMAVGGYATLKGVLDVFFKLYPRGGFIYPKLTTINETTPNTYYCENPQDLGLPSRLAAVVKDPFVMEVVPISDDGNVMHRITTCPSDVNEVPLMLVRSLQGAEWKPWFNVVSGEDYA